MIKLYEGLFLSGDYKTTFTEKVDELMKQELTIEFKNKLIQALTDSYIEETGKVPDSYELTRLATWLVEDKSNDPHKVSKTEYPILSTDQVKLRWRRELVSNSIETATSSSKYKINGKRKPKNFKVFGEYEGGN